MFLHPQFHAVVADLERVLGIGRQRLIDLVCGVEVPPHLPGHRVNHRADALGRHDDPLFAEHKLPDEAVVADVQRLERAHGVGVDTNAERAVVVDVVGLCGAEIGEEAAGQAVQLGALVEEGVDFRQGIAKAQNVLRFAAALHVAFFFRAVQLIADPVGQTVPLVPFKAGIIIAAHCLAADKNALCDFCVVPCGRHELVGHAVSQLDLAAARTTFPRNSGVPRTRP